MASGKEETQSLWHAVKWGCKWGFKRPFDAYRAGDSNRFVKAVKIAFWLIGWGVLYTWGLGILYGIWRYYQSQ